MPESTSFPTLSIAHPRPTSMHQLCQVPPASLPPDEDTALRDLTLLFKQKTFLQHSPASPRRKNFFKEIIWSLLTKPHNFHDNKASDENNLSLKITEDIDPAQ